MLTLMNSMDATKDLNVAYKTATASMAAAAFRIFLMPVVSGGLVKIYLLSSQMFVRFVEIVSNQLGIPM